MRPKIRLLTLLLTMAFLTTACGASSKYESAASAPMAMDMAVEEAAVEEYYGEEPAEMETGSGVTTNSEIAQTAQTSRKLIRTFDLNIQTKEFDEVLSGIQTKVQELGGYIEQSSLDGGSAYYKNYNRYNIIS